MGESGDNELCDFKTLSLWVSPIRSGLGLTGDKNAPTELLFTILRGLHFTHFRDHLFIKKTNPYTPTSTGLMKRLNHVFEVLGSVCTAAMTSVMSLVDNVLGTHLAMQVAPHLLSFHT